MQKRLLLALAAVIATGSIGFVHAQAPAAGAVPTFTKDVAPIFYKNCVACHRPGEMGPMSLLSYESARPYARSIATKVGDGAMPPWHAESAPGVFKNDPRLTAREKATIVQWATNGAPQGNPKDLPPAPVFAEGWQIGKPDLILTMEKPYAVPAEGTIAYQNFSIPTNFTEDKWVQAIEVRAGTPAVVHHVLVYSREPDTTPRPMPYRQVQPASAPAPARPAAAPVAAPVAAPAPPAGAGAAAAGAGGQEAALRRAQQASRNPGIVVGMLAPHTNPQHFEPGQAMLIRKGAVLTLQMHYTANGTAATDQSSIGLIFAKEPPQQEVVNAAFLQPQFVIPAGAVHHRVDSAIEFTEDAHVIGMVPHTHLRGTGWEYTLVKPDGSKEKILSVPHYQFNWQTYYEFAKPLAVPKGSRIEAEAYYDNSASNKANPNPAVDVRWGEQTWEEMQYTAISFTVDDHKPAAVTQSAQR